MTSKLDTKLQPGDVLSARDAANRIGVHFTTVYRWIQKNEIAYVTFGGSFFIPFLEVERKRREINRIAMQPPEVENY